MNPTNPLEQIRTYHQRTKHSFERYAAGPGYMDWSTQPDPFRRYAKTAQLPLPLGAAGTAVRYADLFRPGAVPVRPLTLEYVGALLELSFGLSAWKSYGGERWALRCNPSSGNLHPTEAYVVAGRGTMGLEGGVYHYQSHDHVLEQRCRAGLPFTGLLVGLSSIHWREAWKYGERAFRYCQHDVGHALGALRYAAAVMGWRVRLLDGWSDVDIARLLGLDRDADFAAAEREVADLLCLVGPDIGEPIDVDALLPVVERGLWQGEANPLSRHHGHEWPVIEETHIASLKPRTVNARMEHLAAPPLLATPCELGAAELIRQRRSAQAFDGVTAISARALWRMLDATLPRANLPPFDAWPWAPDVHLVLFVHRVQGLTPGLYVLVRSAEAELGLRTALRAEFAWQRPADCPEHLRVFRLVQADCQRAARSVSCHQDIARNGAFSMGMLAEFDQALQAGAWHYRRLFWECGLIGQALYLEAEAAGVRGTGIGCFFDDPVHELLGLHDTRYQSLYHFTVGTPLLDNRLETWPPYGHLRQQRVEET